LASEFSSSEIKVRSGVWIVTRGAYSCHQSPQVLLIVPVA
jgi:hypothetical protein